jgi:regulator of protease activity HflC (stomatin/prohibitin superfamily)
MSSEEQELGASAQKQQDANRKPTEPFVSANATGQGNAGNDQPAATDTPEPLAVRTPPVQGAQGQGGVQGIQGAQRAQGMQAEPPAPSAPGSNFLKLLWQYLSVPLVPFLFLAITCLIVLPILASGRAQLPASTFWPVTVVLLAIALAQGIALTYAGNNNSLWAISNVGAFCLFLLVATFTIFGLLPGILLFIVLLALVGVVIRLYLAPVPEGYVTILYAFGKYSRTLEAGFNIRLPWETMGPELNIAETQWNCPPQRVQMSRTEDVILRATFSYQLLPKLAYLAVTQVNRWEDSLQEVCIATLQTLVTTFTPDDLIIWQRGLHSRPGEAAMPAGSLARWEQVNAYLFEQIRDRVEPWGVQLNWVRIHDIVLAPHNAPVIEEALVTPTAATAKAAQAPTEPDMPHPVQAKTVSASPPSMQPPPAAQPIQSRPPVFTLPKTLKDEDLEKVLTGVYNQVRDERITDPDTIRSIADTFAAIAADKEKSKLLSFDAERASLTLYKQARKYEDAYATNTIYTENVRQDWPLRRHSDENLMAGG